jgi:hypothetical protein
VPYQKLKMDPVELPERKIGRYEAVDHPFKYVPERF